MIGKSKILNSFSEATLISIPLAKLVNIILGFFFQLLKLSFHEHDGHGYTDCQSADCAPRSGTRHLVKPESEAGATKCRDEHTPCRIGNGTKQ